MSPAIKIYKKELKELLKDKRTRTSAFFGPFFLVFMLMYLFGTLATTLGKPSSQTIYVLANQQNNVVVSALEKSGVKIKTVPDIAKGKKLIKAGTVHLLVEFPNNMEQQLQRMQPIKINEYFDPNQETAAITKGIFEGEINGTNKVLVQQLLMTRGVSKDLSDLLAVKEVPVTDNKNASSTMILGMIPYLIVIWAFYGGMGAVGDLVAGEKEKNTLETLLISPVSRLDIALGKLLALSTLCFTSSISSLLGLVMVYLLHLPATAELFKNGLGITPVGIVVILAVLVPTVLLFASVLLAISTRARNIREAYTQLSLVSFVVLMPAIFSQFIGYTDYANAHWVSAVPVLGTATTIRQALLGTFDPLSILLSVGVCGVIAALTLRYTIALFQREDVLLRV